MPAKATTDTVKHIHYLAASLKAPRITEAAARLADQARDAGWTHEDYLAAVLEREVSARNASGAELRIAERQTTSMSCTRLANTSQAGGSGWACS